MLEYDRIDISEGFDVNKTSASKECNICHYWYFKDIDFKYKPYLCNGCHDLTQKAMNFNDVAIVYVKGNGYRIHFWYISKVHNRQKREMKVHNVTLYTRKSKKRKVFNYENIDS